jgi:hypothetical protein
MNPGEGAVPCLGFFVPEASPNDQPSHLLTGSADGCVAVWKAGAGAGGEGEGESRRGGRVGAKGGGLGGGFGCVAVWKAGAGAGGEEEWEEGAGGRVGARSGSWLTADGCGVEGGRRCGRGRGGDVGGGGWKGGVEVSLWWVPLRSATCVRLGGGGGDGL